MREQYLVYPDATEKLRQSGLEKRILDASKKDDTPGSHSFGILHGDEMRGFVDELKDKGYYKNPPKDLFTDYKAKLTAFVRKKEDHRWTTDAHGVMRAEESEWDDFLLLSGYLASFVLKPKEFWDAEKLGFSLSYDCWGVIGATLWSQAKLTDHREGYVWASQANECSFVSRVTGDSNGDFRIFRDDLTPYPTKDPLGNDVRYRPKFRLDEQWVAGYHSYEPIVLAIAIKYAEQEQLPAQVLTPEGRAKLLDEMRPLGSRIGNFADAGSQAGRPWQYFMNMQPIPTLTKRHTTQEISFDRIGTTTQGYSYGAYILPDKSLCFASEEDMKKPSKRISLSILPQEIDHFIKGLFVQCAKGLGRTLVGEMVHALNYRFSEKYAQYKQEWDDAVAKNEKRR